MNNYQLRDRIIALEAAQEVYGGRVAVPRFTVYGFVRVPVFTVVEARDKEHAREIADDRPVESCAEYCSNHPEGRESEMWCLQDDLDSFEPQIMESDAVQRHSP